MYMFFAVIRASAAVHSKVMLSVVDPYCLLLVPLFVGVLC